MTAKLIEFIVCACDGPAGQTALGRWLLVGLLALPGLAAAQAVIAPPPEVSATPSAMEHVQNGPLSVIPQTEKAPGVPPPPSLLQYGPLTLRPHLLYRFLYGNGIQSGPGEQRKTLVQSVAPGMLMELGTHWVLDYTPTLTFYSSEQFHDTLDHSVRLAGGAVYENWIVGLEQDYNRSEDAQIQTAQQTSQETYSTALNATYHFGGHMSVDMSVNQNLLFVEQLTNIVGRTTNSREWSTMDWLNYQFWPRLDAGLGLGVGYVDVDVGPNSIYEQYQGRIRWQATDKLGVQVSGGLEDRQFLNSGISDLINPIFGASVQYRPFETTTLALNANRAVSTSYYQSQVTETTGVNGSLTQRFLQRFYLNVGGGYQIARYVASASGVSAGTKDDTVSFNARLSTAILKRGTIAAVYQFSQNTSNRAGFGYSSSQFGFEIGYQY